MIKLYKGYDLTILTKKTIKKGLKWDKLFDKKYEIDKRPLTDKSLKIRAKISHKMEALRSYKDALIRYNLNYKRG
jgi:hypothetical protein